MNEELTVNDWIMNMVLKFESIAQATFGDVGLKEEWYKLSQLEQHTLEPYLSWLVPTIKEEMSR